jgi:outer membrane protein OmpA-like peptidoglycan-associated protein
LKDKKNIQFNKLIIKFIGLVMFGNFLMFASGAMAQYTHECEEIDTRKAVKLYEKAIDLPEYKKSETYELLLEAIKVEPDYFDALYVLAEINYFKAKRNSKAVDIRVAKKSRTNFSRAENYFLKVVELCPSFNKYHSYYFLGEYYHYLNKREESAKYLRLFVSNNTKSKNDLANAKKMLNDVETYLDLINNPVPFDPVKVTGVSSEYDEYLPLISPDGELVFFTKKYRKKPMGELTEREFEEFTFSEKLNSAGVRIEQFSEGKKMPFPFNTGANQGGVTISIDNNHLFVTICNFIQVNNQPYNNCDIYTSDYEYGEWTNLRKLDKNINGKTTWEGQPTISADGKKLFFASARPGGFGGIDLYQADKDENGNWTQVKNLGSKINTKGNEKSPFIHSDSQTLYFSSDKLIGLGGFDIFYTKYLNDGTWSVPKNIGYPINTEDDDLGFVVSTDGKNAYFSSNKLSEDGGWDIYSFELYEEAKPEKVLFVKGQLIDAEGNELTDASLELKSAKTKRVTEGLVDKISGKYAVAVPIEKDEQFLMTVRKNEYAFSSQFINPDEEDFSKPVSIDFEVKPIEVGTTVKINNIHFATNSYELKETSKFILDNFLEFLNENSSIKVEIHGHTDKVGNDQENLVLSKNRAKAVSDYLVEHGIGSTRLSSKGFGEDLPVASNETEEGRALNRRTEFVIVEK